MRLFFKIWAILLGSVAAIGVMIFSLKKLADFAHSTYPHISIPVLSVIFITGLIAAGMAATANEKVG